MSFDVALAEEIWTAKYRFAPPEGAADGDFAATVDRVAAAVAEAEAPDVRDNWRNRFREAMHDFRFLPAAGSGVLGRGAESGGGGGAPHPHPCGHENEKTGPAVGAPPPL